ncbi:anthocyanidin 3-O-glucosyltransferase 2-like [Populus alba x Populus x berolinensis]|uniref:anthocyanidin 3-O-glucosyltransferase n=1 Tax=Populus alba x Populus x berolinensis TaxID=444605 RepID=A0AAD6LIC3_9ROSI|nr:anthocyanidin 3-O-glucosyltransferase 2-like [Populus alba x Populus x berolinensis]
MKKAEVVLIPLPAMGHIVAVVEIAKLLVQRDDRIYTTVLVMHPTLDPSTTEYMESLAASTLPDRMRVINLPRVESITSATKGRNWLTCLIEGQKPHVKEYVSRIRTQFEMNPDSPRLAGFVFDTFATGLKDVSNEFGIPWYVFSAAVSSLSDGKTPPVYQVGPIVKHIGDGPDPLSDESNNSRDIMGWLDDQPPSSVMFLCFGSWGSFKENQVKEIAFALERSGHRFLWSLRKPSQNGKMQSPSDYENFQSILPQGFLDRTAKIGKVIGWAPQVEILSHSAVGGFASHCGWNSILESLRFGVPIATWPLYAEQQFNAFQMVIELGLAFEIKMDYRKDFYGDTEIIVSSDDILKAIKSVMEQDSEIRKKVKEMSRVSEKTLVAGGSSFSSLGRLIEDMMGNMS